MVLCTLRPGREEMRRAELSGGGWRNLLGPRVGDTDPMHIDCASSTCPEGPHGETCRYPRQANNFMSHQADRLLLSVQLEGSGN